MEVVMLEHYFRGPSTVDQIRANWLAPQIEHYVEWMYAQNYAAHNILRRAPLLCHFADFAREKGATDLNSATSFVETFASHWVARANCKNAVTRRNFCDDIQSAILQMLRLALEGRVTQNRPPKRFLLQSEAPGVFRYLREERGFCEGVISRYLRFLNRFALYLKRVGVTSLSELSPPLLSSFVIDTAPGLARTTRRDLCGVVRTFLRSALRSRRFGAYTLQAAIAAVHAESSSVASTDWRQITLLYDQLLRIQPSPVVELNRAVAVAMCEGLEQRANTYPTIASLTLPVRTCAAG
jgi:integrase/recombinase XerD